MNPSLSQPEPESVSVRPRRFTLPFPDMPERNVGHGFLVASEPQSAAFFCMTTTAFCSLTDGRSLSTARQSAKHASATREIVPRLTAFRASVGQTCAPLPSQSAVLGRVGSPRVG